MVQVSNIEIKSSQILILKTVFWVLSRQLVITSKSNEEIGFPGIFWQGFRPLFFFDAMSLKRPTLAGFWPPLRLKKHVGHKFFVFETIHCSFELSYFHSFTTFFVNNWIFLLNIESRWEPDKVNFCISEKFEYFICLYSIVAPKSPKLKQ